MVRTRRQSRWALRADEQRFRAIFEQAAAGILVLNPDCSLKDVNGSFCRLVGYTTEELAAMGDVIASLSHPDDLETSKARVTRLTTGDLTSYEVEKRYIRKDGHEVWVNLRASAVRDETGRIQELLGIFDDVSDYKRAEASLRARARQQAAISCFGQRALSGMPLEQLFDEVVQTIADTLDIEWCKVLRLLPGQRELQLEAGVGWGEGMVGRARVGADRDSTRSRSRARSRWNSVPDRLRTRPVCRAGVAGPLDARAPWTQHRS